MTGKPMKKKETTSEKVELTLVYDRGTRQHHILNDTAGRIWELSDGSHTIDDMVKQMSGEFRASEDTLRKDVMRTVEDLSKLGIIIVE